VEVYATVTDANGQPVTGLEAGDFQVSEDGRPQTITAFAAGEFPLAVAIGVDRSFSMTRDRLSTAKTAARAFIRALDRNDQAMVLAIGSGTEVVAPLSTDHEGAIAALERLDSWGTTPLYDATLEAIDAIQPAAGRRAMILLSDGNDRYSHTTENELVDQVRRRDVLVYPVAIGSSRAPVFAELASVTGGRSFLVRNPGQTASTLETIARELHVQYLLGYSPPSHAGPPRWRSIQVAVRRPGARVRARDGYLSR
jgi:VWFA-related protein